MGNIYQYNTGDGNDVIIGLQSRDSLIINGTRQEITRKNDGDIILGVGSNSITVKNYFLFNDTSDTIINGTSYSDSIINNGGGDNVTITASAGDDLICNYGSNVTISSGDGNDRINNYNNYDTTINGGDGNDTIYNYNTYGNQMISGGKGNDRINNYGSNVTISGGAGNDYISNGGSNVTIDAGAGNDTITNSGGNVIISGGAGDDTIILSSYSSIRVIEYAKGDGNDLIQGMRKSDTLIISGAKYSTTKSNDGVIVTAGSGKITLKGVASLSDINIQGTLDGGNMDTVPIGVTLSNSTTNTVITGTDYADSIKNYADNVNISGRDSADYISNDSGSNVTISGGDSNDTIRNSGSNVTISGGEGNDSIFNSGDSITVSGGTGNDSINNSGSNVTISGGTGDDTISLPSYSSLRVIEYENGDGNDYVSGFKASDTLIISGTKYSTTKSGNDVIVTAGSGKITLKGAASIFSSLKIKGTIGSGNDTIPSGKNITNSKASTLVTGTAYDDTIKNSAAKVTIQGNAGADRISITSAAKNNVIVGGAGNDSIYSSVTSGVLYKYAKGDGNDYIKGWTAKDTLTITGGAYKTSTTGSNVLVSITGGAKITLAGAKGKTININPKSSTSKIINSDVSSLILFDDDNFVTDSAQIDSVTQLSETNYSVGNVTSLTGYNISAQDTLLVTAAYDK